MALTKINFYLGFLACYIMIVSTSMLFMVEQTTNTDIIYTNDTNQYVTNFVGAVDQTNISTVTEVDINSVKGTSIIGEDNETGENAVTDFLANINFYSSRISKIGSYIKLIYNAPSFVLFSLGISEYEEMRHIINIIGVVLFISVLILLLKQIRGS